MKAFSELSHRGQVRRLHGMVKNALAHYPLKVNKVSLIQHTHNAVFRIDTEDGTPYVMRINVPDIRKPQEIEGEMTWLAAIKRDTDLSVPNPLATKDGKLMVTVEAAGVPEARHCVVFSWVGGRHFKRKPSTDNIRKLGQNLAYLHQHADTFSPPNGFWLSNYERVAPPERYDGMDDLFPSERRELFQTATVKAQGALDKIFADKAGLRVIHADLHLGNVKISRGKLQLFDFDDCVWGYPVQDIGISLYYLQYVPNFPENRDAFIQGYTDVRPSPETYTGQLDALIAARELHLVDYVLKSENPQLVAYRPHLIGAAERRLGTWLEA
jgi:Ser/Thr protein kinase RdoA (MazF antagonist)